MIVPAMKLEEVHSEMMRDYESVKRKAHAYAILYQKEMFRKNLQHETRTTKYKTAHYNEWTLVFEIFKEGIKKAFYIESTDEHGLVAYSLQFALEDNDIWLMKFNSHFFKRYRERLMTELTDTSQLIKHYFKHNLETDIGESQIFEDGTRLIQHVTKEGIGIGWEDNAKKVIHFKTFLPHHMLNKGQKDLVAYIRSHNDDEEFYTSISTEHLKKKF